MSYSIIRVVKVKSKTNTRGIQRENKNYENIDIDLSKSYLNYDLVNDTKFDFNKKIDEKIEKNYKGKRKIRTDVNSGLKMLFYGGLKMSFFSGLRLS
ncbi:plasmid recombination protein, partial [Staphylococcus aureus]|nr:plasmid recombination protein [Staphylococcus aureus]